MKQALAVTLSAILMIFAVLTVSARTEDGISPNDAHISYILQISPECSESVATMLSCAEIINLQDGYYRTDNFSLIEQLGACGALLYYEKDLPIYLESMASDLVYYDNKDDRFSFLGAAYAAEHEITGENVVVGVIDSGLSASFSEHSDAKIIKGTNFLVDKEDTENRDNTEDTYGHGTFVTSILCDREIGLSPNITVVVLKCFDQKDSSISAVMEAIYAAVDVYHCDIINLSFGTTDDVQGLKDAVRYAVESGVIVVASSGNLSPTSPSTGNDEMRYPAAYDGVIGVGSVGFDKVVAKTSAQNASVDFVAPGDKVRGISTKTGTYTTNSGTSFSAPVVTSLYALALSCRHDLTPEKITVLLAETSEDLGEDGYDVSYGNGLVNAGLFLAALRNDCESILLSRCGNICQVSAILPDADAVSYLAVYEENGRLMTLETTVGTVCNLPLPDHFGSVKLFHTDAVTGIPLFAARCYR